MELSDQNGKEALEKDVGGQEKAAKLLCILRAANDQALGGPYGLQCQYLGDGKFVLRSPNFGHFQDSSMQRALVEDMGISVSAVENMQREDFGNTISFSLRLDKINIDEVYMEKARPVLERLAERLAQAPGVSGRIASGIHTAIAARIVLDHEGKVVNPSATRELLAHVRDASDLLASELGLSDKGHAGKQIRRRHRGTKEAGYY